MKHYLNNAGAGTMSAETLTALEEHLRNEIRLGAYKAAQDAKAKMSEFYGMAAQLINAEAEEIAFMDSASRGWNMALYGAELKAGDVIVTLASEFGTNLVSIYHLAQNTGASVKVIPCDEQGRFDFDSIKAEILSGAKMVALSHVAAHGSIVNPVAEIGKVIGTLSSPPIYLVDGCQAVGQIKVDVKAIGCDAYTGTGRKWLRGPRGTGFLYVRRGAPLKTPQVDLASADLVLSNGLVTGLKVRSDARQFELWERSVAGMLAFTVAIKQCLVLNFETAFNQARGAAKRLREAVTANTHLRLIGQVESQSNVVGFYLVSPEREQEVKQRFEKAGVGFSTMSDWDCPLHFPQNGASCIFRLSPHHYTNSDAISAAVSVISGI